MDITLDKSSATEASIKIMLNEADYQPKVEEKVKEYRKKANIKGFRPGKVPASLIKKMYGKSILVEELNHILSHALSDYIKSNDLKLIGDPLPKTEKNADIDLDNQKEFEFEYEVGLVDDFEYQIPKEVTDYEIEVSDEVIDENIENIRIQHGKMTNPEKVAEGDFIYGDLKQIDGDIERSTVISTTEIDEKEKKQFIGSQLDDVIIFDIRKTFKDDSIIALVLDKKKEEVADVKGDFSFKITKINRREPADMDQSFFDAILGKDTVKTEAEFRDKVKESLETNYKRESDQLLTKNIQEKVIEKTEIDIPDNFFKKWLLAVNKDKVKEEDIEKDYDKYVKELKWTLISNKIAEENDIKVENEEVKGKAGQLIMNYLQSSGMPAEQLGENLDKFVENYLHAEEGKNYMNIYEQVKNEKTIDLIKDKTNLKQKKVSMDEFKELSLSK